MKLRDINFISWTQEQYKLSKQKWKGLEHKKLMLVIIVSFIAVLATVVGCYLVIPGVTNIVIARLKELRNGTHILRTWQHQPVPFITNVYLWNLTNPDEVVHGLSNPQFQQAGPYVFEQITEKIPLEFKDNSIVYKSKTIYRHRADLTKPASLDDTVITLQAALYGAAVLIDSMAPSMMSILEGAAPSLFPGINSIFMPVRVGDYLFDGVILNCSDFRSPAALMVCGALPNTAPPTIRKLPNSPNFAYSFLSHKNNTELGPFEENRGLVDIHQLAQIIKYQNESEMEIWQSGTQCNQLRGTDTMTFAPFISKDDKIEIFITDVCQVLPLYYQEEDTLQGLSVYKFVITNWLESKDTNTENKCYCMEDKEQFCSKNGVRDISECMKAPVVISLPHFLKADEEFREYAQGSSPDPEKHLSFVYIEPQSGTPVKAAKRIQFNMPLMRIPGFSFAENVTEGLFPLVWLEETILLDNKTLWPVKFPLWIEWLVNFICVCVGSLMAKIFVCSLLSYLYLTKACCFRNTTSNRVTALFYRPRSPSASDQTST